MLKVITAGIRSPGCRGSQRSSRWRAPIPASGTRSWRLSPDRDLRAKVAIHDVIGESKDTNPRLRSSRSRLSAGSFPALLFADGWKAHPSTPMMTVVEDDHSDCQLLRSRLTRASPSMSCKAGNGFRGLTGSFRREGKRLSEVRKPAPVGGIVSVEMSQSPRLRGGIKHVAETPSAACRLHCSKTVLMLARFHAQNCPGGMHKVVSGRSFDGCIPRLYETDRVGLCGVLLP